MDIDLRDIPVYYITLPGQERREKTLIKELNSAGFRKLYKVDAVKHETSFLGVSLSHLKAIRIAESKGYPFIVVEDDAAISTPISSISLPDNTDIFYLGVAKSGSCFECGGLSMATGAKYERYSDGLYRAISLFCDHGKVYFTKKATDAQKRMIANSLKNRVQHDTYMWKECRDLLCLTTRFPVLYQNDPDPNKKLWKRDETMIDIEEYISDGRMEICDECNSKR